MNAKNMQAEHEIRYNDPRRSGSFSEDVYAEYWLDPKTQDHRSNCAECNRPTLRSYGSVWVDRDAPYLGNARVVRREPDHAGSYKGLDRLRLTHGQWASFRYGKFCRLRCAEAFANAAHDAGYRRRA